jgi:hypothetical protein
MFILMLDVIEELANPIILARPGTRSSSHECKPTCVGRGLFVLRKATRLPGTGAVSEVMEATPAALALWSIVILLQQKR